MNLRRQSSNSVSTATTVRPAPAAVATTPLFIGLALSALVASTLLAATAHATPTTPSAGRERTLFTWSGRVDREVYITVRGRDVETRGEDARLPNRARVNDALPRTVGAVLVQLNDGRGVVDVIEQPNARNGYQAVIRVRDPRGGADNYRVTAFWQGDDRYDDRNDGRYDNRDDCRPGNNGRGWGLGRDKNRDGDCDRDRDNRGRDDRDNRNGGWDDRGGANESGLLSWSGRVDDVVEIRISGRRVDAITRSGVQVQSVNSNIRGGLPQRNVTVSVDQRSGRGSVYIAQQPSSWNGYTAVIRINDSRSGADFYDFTARW